MECPPPKTGSSLRARAPTFDPLFKGFYGDPAGNKKEKEMCAQKPGAGLKKFNGPPK